MTDTATERPQPTFGGMLRAEWLRLRKRPMTLVLLAVFLALLAIQLLVQSVFVQLTGQQNGGAGLGMQTAAWQRRLIFPGVFGTVFNHTNGLGGILAIILAAGSMGGEYSWGTMRAQLAREPDRLRYLLAKIAALLLALLASMGCALALGTLLALALGALTGAFGSVQPRDILLLPAAMLQALYVLLPYVLLTIAFTILGRSQLAGVVGGLLYLVFEGGVGGFALFGLLGGVFLTLYNLLPGQNINVLVMANAQLFGLEPEMVGALRTMTFPPYSQAIAVVAVYCAMFLAIAAARFGKTDIQ